MEKGSVHLQGGLTSGLRAVPQPRLPPPTLSSASQLFSASPAPPPTVSSLCLSLSLGEKQTLHLCCSDHLGQLPRAAPTP